MINNGTVDCYTIRNIQQATIVIIPYYLLPSLLFSIISVTTCSRRSRHDEYRDSEESYSSYASSKTEEGQRSKSIQETRNMKNTPSPAPKTIVPAEKDVHVPESVVTEEIFVPIGKSSRDPLPSKGVMTANKNKITSQTGTGISHARIPPPSIRFTEERHRSRTISIFNEQKPGK